MGDWDFWTHGVSAQIEAVVPGQEVVRQGWGTTVRQPDTTGNWFHFAIPTPPQLDSDGHVEFREAFIRAKLNENAKITRVHVRDGGNLNLVKQQDNLDLRGPDIVHNIVLPHRQVLEAAVVCVRVEFMGVVPKGEVVFNAVGVRFNE